MKRLKGLRLGLVLSILICTSFVLGMFLQVTRPVKAEEKGIVLKDGFVHAILNYEKVANPNPKVSALNSEVIKVTIVPNSTLQGTEMHLYGTHAEGNAYRNTVNIGSQYYNSVDKLSYSFSDNYNNPELTIYCTGAVILEGGVGSKNVSKLKEVNISGTALVGDASGLFSDLPELEKIDMSNVNTENCTSMSGMLNNLPKLKEFDMSDTTPKGDISKLFVGMSALEKISMRNVTLEGNMSGLFSDLKSLEELDLTGADTENCTSMASWFTGDYYLSADKIYGLNDLNTSNCEDFSNMLFNLGYSLKSDRSVTFDLDISNFVIKSNANTENMLPSEGDVSVTSMKLPKHADKAFLKAYDRRWQTWLDLDTNGYYYGLGEIPKDRVVHITRFFDESQYEPYKIVDTSAAPEFKAQAISLVKDELGIDSSYSIKEIHFYTSYTGDITSNMVALDPQHRYEDYWKGLKSEGAGVNSGGYTGSGDFIDWYYITEGGTAYASFSDGVLNLYTPASKFIMPQDASRFFADFPKLSDIDSLSSLDFADTTNIARLFSNTDLELNDTDFRALDNGVGYTSTEYMFSDVYLSDNTVLDLSFIRGGNSKNILAKASYAYSKVIVLPKEYKNTGAIEGDYVSRNPGWYDTIDKKYYKDADNLPDGEHKLVRDIGGLFVDIEPITVQNNVILNTGEKYSEQAVKNYVKSQVESIQADSYNDGRHSYCVVKGNTELARKDICMYHIPLNSSDDYVYFDATNIKLKKTDNDNAYTVYYNVGETVNQTAIYFGEPVVVLNFDGVENQPSDTVLKTDTAVNHIKMAEPDDLLAYGSSVITVHNSKLKSPVFAHELGSDFEHSCVGICPSSIRTEDNDIWRRDFIGYAPYGRELNADTDLKVENNRLYIQLENSNGDKAWYKTNVCYTDCPDPVYDETIIQEPTYELEGKKLLVNKQNDKAHFETIAKLVKPADDKPSDSGNTKPDDDKPSTDKPSDSGNSSGNTKPDGSGSTKPDDSKPNTDKPSDSGNTKPTDSDSTKPNNIGDTKPNTQGIQPTVLGVTPTEVVNAIGDKVEQGKEVITSIAKAPITGDSYIDIPLKIIVLLSGSSLILLGVVKKRKK